MKRYKQEFKEDYLKYTFDFPEFKNLSLSDYKKLNVIFEKRDKIIDKTDSSAIDKWLDFESIEDIDTLFKSENYLLKLLIRRKNKFSIEEKEIFELTKQIIVFLKKIV